MVTVNDARHRYNTAIEQGRLFDVVTQEEGIDVLSRNLPDSFLDLQQMSIGDHTRYHPVLKIPSISLKPRRISIFSFFAGAGFLDLGFESNTYKVVYVHEKHRPFLHAYRLQENSFMVPHQNMGTTREVFLIL